MGGMASVMIWTPFSHCTGQQPTPNSTRFILKPSDQSLRPCVVRLSRGSRKTYGNSQDVRSSTLYSANISGFRESRCSGCSTKRHMAGDRGASNFAPFTFQDRGSVLSAVMFSDKTYRHSHLLPLTDLGELLRGLILIKKQLSIKLRLHVLYSTRNGKVPLTLPKSIRAELITVIL